MIKTAIVTGSTRGIGFDTARKLAQRGFAVVVTGRSQRGCDEAAARIADATGAPASGMALDLASLADVRRFAAAVRERGTPVHVLVNNAGVINPGKELQLTADGHEAILATNVLGHFLLTQLLLDAIAASAPARIVNVSSRWHMPGSGGGAEVDFDFDNLRGEKRYDPIVFYKNSKLATMWVTYEQQRRLGPGNVTVNAVCPGWVPETTAEHASGLSRWFQRHVMTHMPGARTLDQASDNTVYAATDPQYATRGGVFIGEETEVRSSEESYDEAKAKRFWELACRLTGLQD